MQYRGTIYSKESVYTIQAWKIKIHRSSLFFLFFFFFAEDWTPVLHESLNLTLTQVINYCDYVYFTATSSTAPSSSKTVPPVLANQISKKVKIGVMCEPSMTFMKIIILDDLNSRTFQGFGKICFKTKNVDSGK
jgi:hypothetical protein